MSGLLVAVAVCLVVAVCVAMVALMTFGEWVAEMPRRRALARIFRAKAALLGVCEALDFGYACTPTQGQRIAWEFVRGFIPGNTCPNDTAHTCLRAFERKHGRLENLLLSA